LTLQRPPRKSNGKHVPVETNFYAQWRLRSGLVPFLREDRESPPETLVQAIWQHQRLCRDDLKTLDGRIVRVLHPGFRSVEGGPDFRAAVVQFGDDLPRSGDIEVDLRASGWRAHGHDRNPAFEKVMLHVVWEGESTGGPNAPPVLALRQVLDAPIGELSLWLSSESAQALPESLRGKCCAPLRELTLEQQTALLREAAKLRLQGKGAVFQARAHHAGWNRRFGKVCFARSATNTMCGPCNGWASCVHAGARIIPNQLRSRRGCSVSAECFPRNCLDLKWKLPPHRLGSLVARARYVLRLHFAPQSLAIPWLASGQPSATAAGSRLGVVGEWRSDRQAREVVP